MASPQVAHGYTKVANAILRALYRFPFSGQELRLLLWVIRDSYGWGEKQTHAAPLSRISEETGIPRATVSWVVRKLVNRAVLERVKGGALRFNKNYDEWLATGADTLPLLAAAKSPAESEAKKSAGSAFAVPTLEQVRAYCLERKSAVDPDKFWHHYESTGWISGGKKVTNWKSSVCYWERTDRAGKGKPAAGGRSCPLCEEESLPNPNAVVCDKCGPRCRACNRPTARLKIMTRADRTKTAVCADGCDAGDALTRASVPAATRKADADRAARFLAERERKSGASGGTA